MKEQGSADATPHHGEGPPEALHTRRGPALSMSVHIIPALPGDRIFVLMVDISGRGRGKGEVKWCGRMQEPAGGERRGKGIRGDHRRWRDDNGKHRCESGAEEGDGEGRGRRDW